jgi:hypothetical protein
VTLDRCCPHPDNLHNRFGCMWNTKDGNFGCLCCKQCEPDFRTEDPDFLIRLAKWNKENEYTLS